MSCYRPFYGKASLVVPVVAAVVLLTPASFQPAVAEPAQQAALSDHATLSGQDILQDTLQDALPDNVKLDGARSDSAKTPASLSASNNATVDPPNPEQPKSLTTRAIEKVKAVAKSAGDIFSRVPCLPPKGGVNPVGSLPRVAAKLASGQKVLIVAFGSSSTQGYGSSAPEFTYPNRLAAQLRRKYPGADITVLNHGVGGEDAPEMIKRLQSSVIDAKPDLVIWQVGTNAVLRNLDPGETQKLVEEGVAKIQAAHSDIVLVDPQYSPRVTERAESASRMVKMLSKVAELRHVGIFPRFEVMREWHDQQALPVDSFVIADGLHMNDWGYACFAQLLGDDIIKSVGQIKLGVNVPSSVQTYRPM
jgi:lysophospholipase L1-like esterase